MDDVIEETIYREPNTKPVTQTPTEKQSEILKKEDEDFEFKPVPLKVGVRSTAINKVAVKPEIKKTQEMEPDLLAEGPDASEWEDISSKLAYSTDTEFLKASHVDLDQVTDESNSMLFFWTDYKEVGDSLALFGKVKHKDTFVSTFLFIRRSKRELYFLPRDKKLDSGEEVQESDVYDEVYELLTKHGVKEFAAKLETKKYCFEMPDIPKETDYLKILYDHNRKTALPMDISGNTFSNVFGTNTNVFEQLVLSREIMGPCWLKIKNVKAMNNVSWCSVEAEVESAMDIEVGPENEAPPMTMMSISLRTVMNRKINRQEVVAISARVYGNISHDTTVPADKLNSIVFTLLRPINNGVFPFGFEKELEKKAHNTVTIFRNEETLLSEFLNRVQQYDPDFFLGHSLENVHMNILVHRLKDKNVQGWSRLGRFRQSQWPTINNSLFAQRRILSGRLVCDISNVFGKSLTLKCNSWTLSEMVEVCLGQSRFDQSIDCSLSKWVTNGSGLVQFITHNETDTHFIASITFKLQMLALSMQLTNLAGNSWARTLSGTRAERNEFILLHQFYRRGYIVPDKGGNQPKHNGHANSHNDNDEDEENDSSNKKKDKYKGGLVFEPEKGLYDHIILVMDFNSLYPSIIQEYNICFTTVDRTSTNADDVPEVPDPSVPLGIFPKLVQNLVQRRRAVKSNMKDPKASPTQLSQWDIKQQALKLTANSMYGCLGYTKSRFYARPLAVLTTFKGREILTNTKELAESNGLKVIYGDTDSVMINTSVDSYTEAIKIGNDFKHQVNERYKLLEIDTDNVFKRMLLHAKKKYAAVNMTLKNGQIVTSIEVKGLDMRRREYCEISKEASQYALNQILGDKNSDEALEQIHEYLRDLASKIRENTIPLVKYIIRNKLGKNPYDYPNGNTMPHVQVAKRRIENGEIVKIDDVIAYIIADDDSQKHPAERAFTLREFKLNHLKPDVDYYLSKQILPPLERLCAPISGTDMIRLADCLGLDTAKYRQNHVLRDNSYTSTDFVPFQSTITDSERFRDSKSLSIRCNLCETKFTFAGISTESVTSQGIRCQNCMRNVSMIAVNAQLEVQIREQITEYYKGSTICTECHSVSRQVSGYGDRCVECTIGKKEWEYGDLKIYNQLLYFDSLFDVDKAKKGVNVKSENDDSQIELSAIAEQNRVRFKIPRKVVEKYLNRCGRRYVDMASIFSFV